MGLFARLLVLSTALLLALPPGWCCAAPVAAGTGETKESRVPPCCQTKHDDKSNDSAPTPGDPHRNCQCCWASASSTAPSKTALPDATLTAIPVAVVVEPVSLASLAETIDTHLPFGSPPLHVLLCTWVC